MVSMFNAAVIFVLGLSIHATQCFPMHSKLFNVLALPLISHGRCFTILKFLNGHEIDDSHNIGIDFVKWTDSKPSSVRIH